MAATAVQQPDSNPAPAPDQGAIASIPRPGFVAGRATGGWCPRSLGSTGDTGARRVDDLGARSSRDPRRTWARLRPPTLTFHNPIARDLAEWADAILHHETWSAWCAAHPDAGDVLPAEAEQ